MKRTESSWESWLTLLLGMVMMTLGGISPARAEPPIHLSPGDILGGLIGGSVGALSPPSAPIRLQAECSHEQEECWKANGLNKNNIERVYDQCWRESKRCPKVCKDEYFSRRKAGMNPGQADPLFQGRRGEDTSCVPGVDARVHPGGKAKTNDSAVRVSVMVGGQPAKAEINAVPVDAQGNEEKRTTGSPNYSRGNNRNLSEPILLYLPAGRYRLKVLSTDRFYHQEQAFPEQVELISVQPGKALEKTYAFGLGRLVVNAHTDDGKPLDAKLNLKRLDGTSYGGYKDYLFFNKSLPLDVKLLSGKYRMAVRRSFKSGSKAFNIEVKDGELTSKTITFSSDTNGRL